MRAPAGPLRAGDSRPRVLPGAGRSEEGRQRLWWLMTATCLSGGTLVLEILTRWVWGL